MFPQLFGKLFATPNKSTSWHGMTLSFFYFKFSIAVPTFLINFLTL